MKNNFKKNKLVLALLASGLMMGTNVYAAPASTTFNVRANILAPCTVTADDLDFGTVDLNQNSESSSNIYVNCPVGVNATVKIGEGLNYNYSENSRMLSQKVGEEDHFINYSLYSDSARQNPFATYMSGPYGGVSIVGTGLDETVPVYGTIPGQSSKPAGTYTDVLSVQVDY